MISFEEFLAVIAIFALGVFTGFWLTVTRAEIGAGKINHMEQKCKDAGSWLAAAELDWGFTCANGLKGKLE